ncbi:FecR family protein [Dyadobacter sp. CY326]|uniref:FecR family protein n=1 Tax=Dyadobacter sp. CY326 TaxID=2907300 RepID=UPI001F487690|nr:FecR family protein [Dyadobacter sp. CY326]MCE7064708.1 FecR family protein [Dyadobacter sp. CY326]
MKDYRFQTVEELATDDMFRTWVIAPTPEISSFWLNWLASNPQKSADVYAARELVAAVHEIYSDELPEAMLQQEIQEIARLAELRKNGKPSSILQVINKPIWRIAAICVLISGLGLAFYKNQNNRAVSTSAKSDIEANDVLIVRENHTTHDMTVLLSDNSIATLTAGSTIRYPKKFTNKVRKVTLTGEAFFDVAKNPEKPFLVYTDETVTKVLGTSFRVKALEKENTVMVLVKTGRVSVYPKTAYERLETKPDHNVAVIVLSPNQQAVFNRKENRLEKGIVIDRQLLSELSDQKELIFDDKPVSQVFKTLQEIYGISIVYDAAALTQCNITAQFSDENLKQRINAICQAIGASYEMVDGRIVISSSGCTQ